MTKRTCACPDCGAALRLEVEGVIHYSVNPVTGEIGQRPIIYDKWNPMCTPRLYCPKCSTPFEVFLSGGAVVEISRYEE